MRLLGPWLIVTVAILMGSLVGGRAGRGPGIREAIGQASAPDTVQAWLDSLEHGSAAGRRAALVRIHALGPEDADLVTALARVIGAADSSDAALHAASALLRAGVRDERARPAIPGLARLLRTASPGKRMIPLILLAELVAPDDSIAVPVLIETLHAWDTEQRGIAARGLMRIGPTTLPALCGELRHGDRDARLRAVGALVAIGSTVAPVCSTLVETLDGAHEEVPEVFAPHLAPETLASLRSGRLSMSGTPFATDAQVRARAATALGELACPASIVPLVAALADSSRAVRASAAGALQRFGAAAVPALVAVLEDERRLSRFWAITVLGDLGEGAVPALDALLGLLDSPSPSDRAWSAWAIGKIGGPEAREAIPRLTALLDDPDATVRARAAGALDALDGLDALHE